jgi:hypothetical protein
MRSRTFIALLLAVVLASITAIPTSLAAHSTVQQPEPAAAIPMLPGTRFPIKTAGGNQTNPSVRCNIASYTNDDLEGTSLIEYFDFATSTTHVVPGNGLDRLSDTDGQRIAFTQLDATGDRVAIYDIVSQTTDFIGGGGDSDPAIGGNWVAYRHGESQTAIGDIFAYDRSTGGYYTLSFNDVQDWWPAVSPDGNVIVYASCQSGQKGCSIYSAAKNSDGTLINIRAVSTTGDNAFPDTNGQLVVYTSERNGDNDIYWQRVGGSTEMHLALTGDQRDARISGNLIVFESQTADSSWDVFVYDLARAHLYQVTNTPGVSETLSDIVAGCDGVNRIVYSVPGSFGDFDLWGFNFQLNDSVSDQLNDLVALVLSFNLHDGFGNSLIAKLQDALAAVDSSNTATACDSLTAFINAAQAQSGKKLTADQVRQLVDSGTQIKADLGCQ